MSDLEILRLYYLLDLYKSAYFTKDIELYVNYIQSDIINYFRGIVRR